MKHNEKKCQGSCFEHKGIVVEVCIYGFGFKGDKFNYCQEAIKKDESMGFVVIKKQI